jgi:CRP-like cAMP-binding protein
MLRMSAEANSSPTGACRLMEKKGDFYRMKMAQQGIQMSEKGAAQLSPMHLQQMWMFRSVPVLSLSKVASLFTSRTLTAGSTLYKPGDLGDTLYVVVAGVVTEMTYEQADGDAIDVEEGEQEESAKPAARATAQVSYGVGDCLGDEHLAYADGFDCQSTASVMETATVMCLSRSMLEKAMDEDSELMEAVQMEVKMKEYILSAAFLRQVWIFSLMTDEQLERIAPCFESSILDIGVVVNLANALYLVAGGALSYTQRVMGGLTQTLTASPASSLGELEIMGLPGPSCAPVKVLMVRPLFSPNPDMSARLLLLSSAVRDAVAEAR